MRLLGLAIAGLLSVAATPSTATSLFVFGDSLVDTGNVDAALRAQGQATRTPVSSGYFQNRFSNGYNFADIVSFGLGQGASTAFGYPVAPYTYYYGGNNFSYGGAQTRDDGHGTAGHSPSFQDQLALFAASGKTIGADDYVLVTFGGNDIQQELLKKVANPDYTPDFSATNAALSSGLAALIGAGARNIVVTGQADVGQIPRITQFGSPALSALGSSLSDTLNEAFRARATAAAAGGANVRFFDLLSFEHDLLANAAVNGFTNTTDPCLDEATGQLADPTCAGYLYFDRIHPTAAAHRLIGTAIGAQIAAVPGAVPEATTWAMMILGMGAIGFVFRRAVRRSEIAFDARIKRIAAGLES